MSALQTLDVHMKYEYIPHYCNISHELKCAVMKIKTFKQVIWSSFMTYILQMFNDYNVSGLADICVFSCSPHVKLD
jgi:hypothetical protein